MRKKLEAYFAQNIFTHLDGTPTSPDLVRKARLFLKSLSEYTNCQKRLLSTVELASDITSLTSAAEDGRLDEAVEGLFRKQVHFSSAIFSPKKGEKRFD